MSDHIDAASVAQADWFQDPKLQVVLSLLNNDGEARVVGGAVRNALMGLPVGDIDIATTLVPDTVVERARAAGIKCVPTGIDHGTVTLVVGGTPFEITTLRVDVATDGRRAQVAFGTDWMTDAQRRDLTMNGLYADAAGKVIDLVGGVADIETGTVRFIGDAATRIEEDYLRILRFFRFFACYGKGRPDADGLRACARLKSGLTQLSAERVWSELKRLLAAADPSRALLWMRQTGVLTTVLPESKKWGIDAMAPLVDTETALGWAPDALLRLMAIIPPEPERIVELARRLRLSNAETRRLAAWSEQTTPPQDASDLVLRRLLYRGVPQAVADCLKLRYSALRAKADTDGSAMQSAAAVSRQLALVERWQRPILPVSGGDLKARGLDTGPDLGRLLSKLEDLWIESDFTLDRETLLLRLKDVQNSDV